MATTLKLAATFYGPNGVKWRMYHGDNRKHRKQFTSPETGELCVGIVWFHGRYKHKVFIHDAQPDADIWDTSVHELLHIALEDVGMLPVIEEALVNETASRLAIMLSQLGRVD